MSFSGLLFYFSLYFKWKVPQKNRKLNSGFPLVWGVGGGDWDGSSPLPRKLARPPYVPLAALTQK